MAAWTILKNAISDIVKTNGNNEITGDLLQSVLHNVIDNVGLEASFKGVATPLTAPGTPDNRPFYICKENGVYVNFGGVEITDNKLKTVKWNGSAWVFESLEAYNASFIDNSFEDVNYISEKKRYNVIYKASTFGGGVTKSQGREFFIDIELAGFALDKFYGASSINETLKTVTIWEVDVNGLYINAGSPLLTLGVIESKESISLMHGYSGNYSGYAVVDWSKISTGVHSNINSIRFETIAFSEHYGEIYKWRKEDTSKTNELLKYVEKAGSSTGLDVSVVQPAAVKAYILSPELYTKRLFGQWLDIVSEIYINSIRIPLVRALDGTPFVGGITVRMSVNGIWILRKQITEAELIAFGINTFFPPSNAYNIFSRAYTIECPQIILKAGDVVFITWSCDNATAKLAPPYHNDTPIGTPYAAKKKITSTTAQVDDYVNVPNRTSENPADWYYTVILNYIDYVAKKIQDGGSKTDETIVQPDKIYTVCRDIVKTDSGFNSKNFAACMYIDHFINITQKKNIYFDKTKSDKYPLFAPISTDGVTYNGGLNVKSIVETIKIKGDTINDISIDVNHVSTKASVTQSSFPKILVIGDSVTGLFLADKPTALTIGKAAGYWQYAKHLFQMDKADAGSGHDALFIGQRNMTTFDVNGVSVRACAEGRGGWTTRNYLYDENVSTTNNSFYDAAKSGSVKFSLNKYLSRYKTLADDGITRLVVGSTAGSDVVDVNAYDVCTPTIVVIQLGFNDVQGNYLADIQLMIEAIKTEYPNMVIIISTIDAAGTYFPEKYSQFESTAIDMLGDSLHSKMFALLNGVKALENVDNKIFYCPNYFIQPTAIGVAFRDVDFPESIKNSAYSFKTEHGTGNNYHPNTYAHAAWGYQLYSLLKYILTLL